MNIFEKASKRKLRFDTLQGYLSVEDLWDLALTSIDELAIELNKKLSDNESGSFIKETTAKNEKLQLQFDIVKHVIEVRLADADKAKKAQAIRERNQLIMGIIKNKENAELEDKTIEELEEMLKEAS